MSKVYYLKWYDDLVGTIIYPECEFIRDANYKKDLPNQLRFKSKDGFTIDKYDVLDFLKSRVVQEDNQGIDIIMEELRYPVYDLEILLDNTFGMTTDDCLWLLPKDKLHWDFKTYHIKSNPKLWVYWVDENGHVHEPLGWKSVDN